MKFHKGRATDAVLDSDLSTLQRLILICYIKHANEDGVAWPGGDRLARMCGTSSRSIKRHRSALMKAGILQLVTGGDGTVYRVKLCTEAIPTGDRESPVTESHRCQRVTGTGDRESPVLVTESHPNIHKRIDTAEIHTSPLKAPQGARSQPDAVSRLWDALSAIRSEYRPKARGLALTAHRRRTLKARLKDYDEERILSAYRWWWTDTSETQSQLRESYDLDTFLRPSRHDRYQAEAARAEEEPEPWKYQPPSEEEVQRAREAESAYRDELDKQRRAIAAEMRAAGTEGPIHYTDLERYERAKHGIINGGTLPSHAAAERARDDILNPCPF